MGNGKRAVLCLIALPALVGWSVPSMSAGRASGLAAGWAIMEARVVAPGLTTNVPEGTLTTGYAVEAKAQGLPGAGLPRGVFRIVISAFSPRQDMPGQRAGVWHVNGQWSITDERAGKAAKAARHSAARVKGRLVAELVFNPALDAGLISAAVKLPATPVAGRMIRGAGRFSGNSLFEGSLLLEEQVSQELGKLTRSQQ